MNWLLLFVDNKKSRRFARTRTPMPTTIKRRPLPTQISLIGSQSTAPSIPVRMGMGEKIRKQNARIPVKGGK